jgi:glycosyltransferase involved in cell wall biosynthesis
MPRVSVVIPSYNHGKFIVECIQSVLDQTYQDFEIIVTDDGSSDDSIQRIVEIDDPRIQLHIFPNNRGACAALNHCIRNASGEFIAFLSSDEAWEPEKLMIQTAYLDNNPGIGAVFSKSHFVDDDSKILPPDGSLLFQMFERNNRTRYEWLNHFFFQHNCLCHPSILVRNQCYKEIGLFDERMASLPDFDMWIRLCFKYEIHVLDEKLVRLRMRAGNVNASGPNMPNIIRGIFEHKQILDHYLSITEAYLFLKIFPEADKYSPIENRSIPYLLGLMAISTRERSNQLWGLEVLYKTLSDDNISRFIKKRYGFGQPDFHRLMGSTDIFTLIDLFARTDQITILDARIQEKCRQIQNLTGVLHARDIQINVLSSDLQEKNNQVNSLTAGLLERDNRINNLTVDLQQRDNRIGGLSAKLQEKDNGINNLTLNLQKNNNRLNDLAAILQEKDARLSELDMHLQKIQRGIPAQLIRKYQKVIEKLLRTGTRRRRFYELWLTGIRIILNEGWRSFWRQFSAFVHKKDNQSKKK